MRKQICQSCGMPIDQDPKGGGTESGGALSKSYCSFCYVNGKFTQPDLTAKQMQEFCKQKLKEMGFGKFKAFLFTICIPHLDRWKKQ